MELGATTTADEVLDGVDLSGRVAVVTGATSGLGLETARSLAAHGATVVLAARDTAKLAAATATLVEQVPEATVTTQPLDLADLSSVRAAAVELSAAHPRLDLLINNAGVMACPLARTVEGFEVQFGTNHLGHFLLTNLLLPALLAAPSPRVVCLSSAGHQESPILWDDPNFEQREYHNWTAYGQSKTANALFAFELDRRDAARGLHAYAVHPGAIMTPLGRHLTEADLLWLAERAERAERSGDDRRRSHGGSARSGGESDGSSRAGGDSEPSGGGMVFKSVEAGAATTVWAATAPELVEHGGAYLADCAPGVPGEAGDAGMNTVAPWARDPEGAARLWELSAELVGLEG